MAEGGHALLGSAALGGQESVTRSRLAGVQRARIVAAMLDVVAEEGLGGATVARVVARSGVSRRTFYENFEDREECFLAAFEDAVTRLSAPVLGAYRARGTWPERLRRALVALLESLAREPAAARVAVVEALGAGPRSLERRRALLDVLAVALDADGSALARTPASPLAAEGAVGGALALIHMRLTGPTGTVPADLLGPLLTTIVLPYLGPSGARRELERSAAASEATQLGQRMATPRVWADPLRNLDMRLTYRTLRVLLTVGELAEASADRSDGALASNRAIGDASGIRDQGQISKLLARLRELGLVSNAAEQGVKGRPNEWRLTERGEAVRQAVSRAESR
jgi:AcrR family transcriptional regulator